MMDDYASPVDEYRSAARDMDGRRRLRYLAIDRIADTLRSARQRREDARRTRFLVVFTILAASWLALLVL